MTELARELGKTPAEANDFPGFVSNRILMPYINEAAHALEQGVAEPEAIDTIAKLGFNHPMGPLALADLIGLDTCVAILEVLRDGLRDERYEPADVLREHGPPDASAARAAAVSTNTDKASLERGRAETLRVRSRRPMFSRKQQEMAASNRLTDESEERTDAHLACGRRRGPSGVATTFEAVDVELDEAPSAAKAAAAIERHAPDVMVLDIQMPGMDGLAFCRAVGAAATRDIGVVL